MVSIEKNINITNLISSIPGGLCIYNVKNENSYIDFLVWNRYMVELTGYNIEEIKKMGLKHIFFLKEEYAKFIANSLDKESIMENTKGYQYDIITKSGVKKTIDVSSSIISTEDGKDNVLILVKDITDRKEIEKALRKSREKFRKLFDNVNDAIFLTKLNENGLPTVYTEVNDVACSRLGYSREELFSMTLFDTNPFITMEKILDYLKIIKEKGKLIYETAAKTKDGKIIPVEINSILIALNDEKYLLSISRDITERKENERALKESERNYRYLIESLPYGVYIFSKGKILFSNKVGLNYLGVSSLEELKNRKYSDMFQPHQNYSKLFEKRIKYLHAYGHVPLTEEKLIRVSDGKIFDLETIVTKLPYDDVVDKFLVVARDISDRKKAELLEKAMLEKSKLLDQAVEYENLRTEFFANISHELRTPVNVILSTLQLLNFNANNINSHNSSEDKYKKHLSTMKQNCYRLIRLINNLIDVTKIDSGYFHLSLTNTNIINVVEDITLSIAEYIENKGISIVFDTEVEEKILAFDPDKIERIVLNLISNAIKFTEPGGNIFVNIIDKEKSIVIAVSDTGIGIPEDKQKMIFERFAQVDKSLTRNREGSGIGLSLVKSLVDMHHGTITLESKPNKGSKFIIELPVYLVDESQNNVNAADYRIQENVEKINIEFSDIYF